MPRPGALQRLTELLQLAVAADEAGEAAGGGRLQPRAHGPCADQLVHLHRLGQPLHRPGAQRVDLHVAFHQLERRGAEDNRARVRELLHPRRQMRRLADGGVVHPQIRADGPHEHVARVQPDADLDGEAVSAAHAVGVLLHRLLHPQRRVARAHGVVLVGQRRAEQRHDAVAHHLVDGALVPVHGLHHVLEDGIQERAGLLGIAVGEQLHRALEIGEEHRDLLALALQRAPGGEDLLGEVLRRVAVRRAPGPRRAAEPLPTAAAKLIAGVIGEPARGADDRERRCALGAEAAASRLSVRHRGHSISATPSGPFPSASTWGRVAGFPWPARTRDPIASPLREQGIECAARLREDRRGDPE